MGKSLTLAEAVQRVHEWRARKRSLSNAQFIGQPRLRRVSRF